MEILKKMLLTAGVSVGLMATETNLKLEEKIKMCLDDLSYGANKRSDMQVYRAFEDKDYLIIHSEFKQGNVDKVAFDVFKIKDSKILNHWSNVSDKTPPNPSGRTQLDGVMQVSLQSDVEKNKEIVGAFLEEVLKNQNTSNMEKYLNKDKYIQHNSGAPDGIDALRVTVDNSRDKNEFKLRFDKIILLLGSGDFVLSISEGVFGMVDNEGVAPSVAFYDLYRVEGDKIVEHWDVIAPLGNQTTF
ncbi:ester cyclase [Helicobacter brantae]|uniref:SnoaL-like domain-containing protein n=1 Tax=Helicobacter brantae TaxID=375927 RepID=A0A3D8J132_9HELI|nr:ester cyclase [Helicobacter brantae]RDU70930.1 hypothetical protein CQA58_03900 [Helicobacter brantae]